MKRDSHEVIDEFRTGASDQTLFQLTKDEDGRYRIKRESMTLVIYPKEEKARKGFETLKERRS